MIDRYLVLCSYEDNIDIIGVCNTYEDVYKFMETDYLVYITGASDEDLKMSYIDIGSARGSYHENCCVWNIKKIHIHI